MTTIVTRAGKGSALTWAEGDANFTNLNNDKVEVSTLAASGGSALVGFVQTGTNPATRTLQSKNRDMVSVNDWDNSSGTANIFTKTEATTQKAFYVPEGNYATSRDFISGLTKRYWGPGTLLDNGNRKRGRYFSNQSTGLASRGNTSDHLYWYAGDYSNAPFPIEHVISAAPVTTGSLVLTANANAGTSVLTFASVPSWVGVGARDVDPMGGSSFFGLNVENQSAPATITAGTKVVNITATTVTLSQPLAGNVTVGQTIRFGWGQYIQPFEANPMNLMIYAAPGTLNANQKGGVGGSGGQVVYGIHVTGKNSAGGGGLGGFHALINVDQPFAGYDPSDPYNTATGFLFGGQVAANCNNAYISGIEYVMSDNNFPGTSINMILNAERQNAGSGRHHFWRMIQFNGSPFLPVDSWMGGNAKAKYGLDMTNGDFSSNFNAAIALKQNQRIYFNSTSDSFGANAVGDSSIYYNSVANKMVVNVGNQDAWQFDANGLTASVSNARFYFRTAQDNSIYYNSAAGKVVINCANTDAWQFDSTGLTASNSNARFYFRTAQDHSIYFNTTNSRVIINCSNTDAWQFTSSGMYVNTSNARIYLRSAADFSLYYNTAANKAILNCANTDTHQWDQTTYFITGAGANLNIGNTQVVKTRMVGWTNPSGWTNQADRRGTAFNTATITLQELAQLVQNLINDLHAQVGHGLIGN